MQSQRSHSGATKRVLHRRLRLWEQRRESIRHTVLVGLALMTLATLVALAYSNILPNGFVWDDKQQVAMNPDLRPGASWLRLFTSDVWGFTHPGSAARSNYYRPLQMVAYRVVGGVFGFEPEPFHVLSILMAVACTLAAFLVYFLLTRRLAIAFSAAALFAVHPVHTEAVDWISALPDLGCTLFVLLSFAFFLRFRDGKPPGTARALNLAGSLLAFATALLWKEPAAVLPAAIAAFAFFDREGTLRNKQGFSPATGPLTLSGFSRRGTSRLRAALLSIAPYACVLAAYLVLRYRALGFFSTPMRLWQLTPAQAAGSMLQLTAGYWRALLEPLPLNAYHYFSPIRSLQPVPVLIAAAVVLGGVLVLGFALCRRSGNQSLSGGPSTSTYGSRLRGRSTSTGCFAALWTILFLLPVMDIWALGRNAFAERYLYLPSVGFCLLVVLVVAAAIRRIEKENQTADFRGSTRILSKTSATIRLKPRLGLLPRWQTVTSAMLLTVAVAAGAVATWRRNPDWQSDATLFRAALPLSPQSPFVHFMVAATEEDSFLAEQEYRQAIRLAENDRPPAIPTLVQACESLASMYGDRGRFVEALQFLAQARQADPADSELDAAEGALLLRAGRWQEAAPLLERAVNGPAASENALNALALLEWQQRHNLERAAQLFRRALEVHSLADDFSASLHNNLGAVYGEERLYPQAAEQFGAAVRIAPNDAEYRTNFAAALAALGRYPDAAQQAQLALQIAPGFPPAIQLLRQLQSR